MSYKPPQTEEALQKRRKSVSLYYKKKFSSTDPIEREEFLKKRRIIGNRNYWKRKNISFQSNEERELFVLKQKEEKHRASQQHKKEWFSKYNRTERAKEIRTKYYLKSNYNLTPEQFEQLKNKQNNQCAICQKTLESNDRYIDHNHATGKVRELLCGGCNRGIGIFEEDLALLHKVLEYIKRHKDVL